MRTLIFPLRQQNPLDSPTYRRAWQCAQIFDIVPLLCTEGGRDGSYSRAGGSESVAGRC